MQSLDPSSPSSLVCYNVMATETCAICLDELVPENQCGDSDHAGAWLKCAHCTTHVHLCCIDEWMERNSKIPSPLPVFGGRTRTTFGDLVCMIGKHAMQPLGYHVRTTVSSVMVYRFSPRHLVAALLYIMVVWILLMEPIELIQTAEFENASRSWEGGAKIPDNFIDAFRVDLHNGRWLALQILAALALYMVQPPMPTPKERNQYLQKLSVYIGHGIYILYSDTLVQIYPWVLPLLGFYMNVYGVIIYVLSSHFGVVWWATTKFIAIMGRPLLAIKACLLLGKWITPTNDILERDMCMKEIIITVIYHELSYMLNLDAYNFLVFVRWSLHVIPALMQVANNILSVIAYATIRRRLEVVPIASNESRLYVFISTMRHQFFS